MTQISETIGRSAVLAAASNYQSVSEALLELITCRKSREDEIWRFHDLIGAAVLPP